MIYWLRIAADTLLAALHYIIQIVQGWGDDYLHQFHIHGKDYGISYDGGIGFPDNPFRTVIDDFSFDIGDRFTYEYNLFEHWLHDVRVVESTINEIDRQTNGQKATDAVEQKRRALFVTDPDRSSE